MSAANGHLSKEFFEFIRSIGECRSKQEEDLIVAKEIQYLQANMHAALAGGAGAGSKAAKNRPDMKQLLVRLIYVEMLGHDASFGHIHGVNMIKLAPSLFHKRIGYLAVTLTLHKDHEFMLLLINSFLEDLKSDVFLEVSMALTAICRLINAETMQAVLPKVLELLDHKRSDVRKKAVSALHRCYQLNPAAVRPYQDRMRKALCDQSPSVMGASLCLFEDFFRMEPGDSGVQACKDLVASFVSILKQIVDQKLPRDYTYHRLPAPWIQMKLLRLLGALGANDQAQSQGMYEVLRETMARADVPTNIGYSVLYECLRTVTQIYPSNELLHMAAKFVRRFITSTNHNLKYLGIQALARLVQIDPQFAEEHQLTVIDCLESKDDSIRHKTLALLYSMTNPANVTVIVEKLLQFLDSAPSRYLRLELVAKIAELAERFSPSIAWYLTTMNNLLIEAGGAGLVRPRMAHGLMRLIAEDGVAEGVVDEHGQPLTVQQYAVETYLDLLEAALQSARDASSNPAESSTSPLGAEDPAAAAGGVGSPNANRRQRLVLPPIMMQVVVWVLGEFGHLSTSCSRPQIAALLLEALELKQREHERLQLGEARGAARTIILNSVSLNRGGRGGQPVSEVDDAKLMADAVADALQSEHDGNTPGSTRGWIVAALAKLLAHAGGSEASPAGADSVFSMLEEDPQAAAGANGASEEATVRQQAAELFERLQNSRSVGLQQAASEWRELSARPDLMRRVLPVGDPRLGGLDNGTDVGAEDEDGLAGGSQLASLAAGEATWEVDSSLGFLDGYVQAAMAKGARAYDEALAAQVLGGGGPDAGLEDGSGAGGLNFEAYAPAPSLDQIAAAAGGSPAAGAGAAAGAATDDSWAQADNQIQLRLGDNVQRRWGPTGYNDPQKLAREAEEARRAAEAAAEAERERARQEREAAELAARMQQQAEISATYAQQQQQQQAQAQRRAQQQPAGPSAKELAARALFGGVGGAAAATPVVVVGAGRRPGVSPAARHTAQPVQQQQQPLDIFGGAMNVSPQPQQAQQPVQQQQAPAASPSMAQSDLDLLSGIFGGGGASPAASPKVSPASAASPAAGGDVLDLFGMDVAPAQPAQAQAPAAAGGDDFLDFFDLGAGSPGAAAPAAAVVGGPEHISAAVERQLAQLPSWGRQDAPRAAAGPLRLWSWVAQAPQQALVCVCMSGAGAGGGQLQLRRPAHLLVTPLAYDLAGQNLALPASAGDDLVVPVPAMQGTQTAALLLLMRCKAPQAASGNSLAFQGRLSCSSGGAAASVAVEIPVRLTDLIRPVPINTQQFAGGWKKYLAQQAGAVASPAALASPEALRARLEQARLFPVQTIGAETIAAGTLVPEGNQPNPQLLFFVHTKLTAGRADVIVRSQLPELSAAVLGELQRVLQQ